MSQLNLFERGNLVVSNDIAFYFWKNINTTHDREMILSGPFVGVIVDAHDRYLKILTHDLVVGWCIFHEVQVIE